MEFFTRDKPENNNIQISQSIIDFMNQNASEETTDNDLEDLKNKEIQKSFKPKFSWRPDPPNRTLDTFQRSVKQDILRSKPKHKNDKNLTKEERLGLNKLRDNPHIVNR